MRNELNRPISAGEDRDQQRDLQGEWRASVLMRMISVLDLRRLSRRAAAELGVAHHLGVVLERVRDLLLLGRRRAPRSTRPCG